MSETPATTPESSVVLPAEMGKHDAPRTRSAPVAKRGGVWSRRLWGAAGLAAFALAIAASSSPETTFLVKCCGEEARRMLLK